MDATEDPPLLPPRTLPPLLGRGGPPGSPAALPAMAILGDQAPRAAALPSGVVDAMDSSCEARRGRTRRAIVAAEADGSLHKLVADARRASHRYELHEVWRRAEPNAAAASISSARPRWHLWLAAVESTLLISLFVLLVGGVAHSLGRCMTSPWPEDIQRPCSASCGLGSALILMCVWATSDRHCRCRFRLQGTGNVNRHERTVSVEVSTCGDRLAPNPSELCVEYTTERVLPRRATGRDDLDKDSKGSFDVVRVGELAKMIADGALPSYSRVRAAQRQCSRIGPGNQSPGAGERSAQPRQVWRRNTGSSRSVENNPWVTMNSFIDMSMPMEFDCVKHERHADLVERL